MLETSNSKRRSCFIAAVSWAFMACCVPAAAQATAGAQPAVGADAQPVTITFEEALHRAQASEPSYAAAAAESRVAALDRSIARAGLLPTAHALTQGIYTQPNRLSGESGEGVTNSNPKFVANDSRPHEYFAQGIVDETLSMAGMAALRQADAAAALAAAQLEISRRGLVSTVTGLYYGALAADHRLSIAEEAHTEAADFLSLTGKREQQREAAHADVVKAQLQEQQRTREWADAKVEAEKARLDLAVLLFPDPRTPYKLAADDNPAALPSHADVEQTAAKNNPELRSALASLNQSNAEVLAARSAYLPTVGLNYTYGIDANEFAVNGPLTADGVKARNLGYSTTWSVNLPVWDWFSTEHKVKQSEIRRDAAKVALSAAQRQMIARLDETYSESAAARDQLASLDASVQTAAESLRLTKLRYTGGEATVLEVVDAQTAFLMAENAREDGRVRYRTALAALQTLTGTM
jgi:outer membrane protein TolC